MRFLKWNGSKVSSVGYYSLLFLFFSLLSSLLLSHDTYATYTTIFRDYGSSQAVDLSPFMFIGDNTDSARSWLEFDYCATSLSSCQYDSQYVMYRVNNSNSFSAPTFNLNNAGVYIANTTQSMIRPDSNNYDMIIPYAQFDCSGSVYVGSSVSFSSELSFDDINYYDGWRSSNGFPGYAGFYPELSPISYNYPSNLPGYSNSNVVDTTLKYSNLSSNKTAISIYELQPHQSNYDYFYLNSFTNNFYLTDYSSNGGNVTFNGVVAGCSETSVKNMLSGLDPNPDPVVPDNFPSSFDTLSNTNNEDAWNIMNNIDPNSYSFQSQDSNTIFSWIIDFFSSLSSLEPSQESCQIYSPAFFGNRFNFGNSVDGNYLFVNLCNNNFVTELWDSGSLLGSVFGRSSFGTTNFFYIGVKGLIWLFFGWLLVKILLGYVYWIQDMIDFVFSTGGKH